MYELFILTIRHCSPLSFQFNPEQVDSLARINDSHLHEAKRLACLLFGSQGIVPGKDRHVPSVHCLAYIDSSLFELNSGRLFIVSISLPKLNCRRGHGSTFHIQGQSTNQTTGIGLHISAHFLPTMERGSIDLT